MTNRAVRSALFVDFDNVYAGLGGRESAAAAVFASDPGRWVDWLAEGGDRAGAGSRRFLVKVCYLSESSAPHRRAYVDSGFRVVDCPTLTGGGKNSADIHLVIDALDALSSDTHYEEFVLASADADLAPLLHRLRARDRRTTVLRGGQSAPALLALCDSHIGRDEFAAGLVEPAGLAHDAQAHRRPPVPAQRAATPPAVRAAADAVRTLVDGSALPVTGHAAADAARCADPDIGTSGWAGARSFGAFVVEHLPQLAWTGRPSPGYVYDPTRHGVDDLPQQSG